MATLCPACSNVFGDASEVAAHLSDPTSDCGRALYDFYDKDSEARAGESGVGGSYIQSPCITQCPN